jgi:hypothetical protein
MTADAMELERLKAMIDAHGSRPERWPAAERHAAEALLTRSAAARALLAETEALDRLLDSVPALAPTADLRAAILATVPHRTNLGLGGSWTNLWRELGGWQLAGTALAASLLLGILVGGALPIGEADGADADLLQTAWLDESFTGY